MMKSCVVCGAEFEADGLGSGRRWLCSDECRSERARQRHRANQKRWRKEDPEKMRERARIWRAKNIEKVREQDRRDYARHRESILEKNRKWREANADKLRDYEASRDREIRKAQARSRYAKNPRKFREAENLRNAQARAALKLVRELQSDPLGVIL
jgi:hypothetical protein